jgi:hypothetical protein
MGVFMSLFKRVLSVVWVLMLLASCRGIPVSTDYEPERDYSALKTYAWKEPMRKIIIDPLLDNDLMSDRIHRQVDARLTVLGYSKASVDEGADFFITFNITSAEKISVDSYYGHYGYHSCWNCYGGYDGFGRGRDLTVRQYTLGALMLDVIDPATERLIWRGVGEKRIPRFKTPQERDLYIAEIVQAILDRFPPEKFKAAT